MRILFVGALVPHGHTYQRKRASEELGHDVIAHSSVPESWELAHRSSLGERLLWKLGFLRDPTKINKTILLEVEKHSPNILWIEKGVTVWPRTLRAVKKLSLETQIVSFQEDNVCAPHNRSRFLTWGLKHYDFIFTMKRPDCDEDELSKLGAKRVVFVYKAYDLHAHRPVPMRSDDVEAFGGNVGFIGTYEQERAESLLYLARNGVPVRVWGAGGWHKLLGHHPNLVIENRPLYGDDYAKGFCATRINLCFLRKRNHDLHDSRTFEIPACGAFMLAERTKDHLRLFEEDKEAAYFESNEELLQKVHYYLEHEDERKAIAAAGRQRCLVGGYSHHDRLKCMLSVVSREML